MPLSAGLKVADVPLSDRVDQVFHVRRKKSVPPGEGLFLPDADFSPIQFLISIEGLPCSNGKGKFSLPWSGPPRIHKFMITITADGLLAILPLTNPVFINLPTKPDAKA